MDGVLRFILSTSSEVGPLHRPRLSGDGPPPRSGEDL
jgi:hypothetical protein